MKDQSRFAFIVGAPRCGTTTLAGFLKQHPDVCSSAVKEPHYFSNTDLTGLSPDELRRRVEREYLDRYFGHCDAGEKLRSEGSVTYLYAPQDMAPILELWSDSKFVIAVRDPLSMLPSLHARLLVTGDETIQDFPTAWAMIEERRQGRSIPRSAIDPRFLRYDDAGRLGTQVQAFFDAVGRERCHVVLFDDLNADPKMEYERLCRFLRLDPWEGTDFKPKRGNMGIRYGWLQRLLKRPPKPVRTVLAGEHFRQREKSLSAKEGTFIRAVFRVRKRLLDWNKVPARRQPLDPALRRKIIDELRDEVILLSRLLDRDLSHWLGGVPEADPGRAEALRA